jgi:hypothetical protein
MAGMYGAPLQGNFPYALWNRLFWMSRAVWSGPWSGLTIPHVTFCHAMQHFMPWATDGDNDGGWLSEQRFFLRLWGRISILWWTVLSKQIYLIILTSVVKFHAQ